MLRQQFAALDVEIQKLRQQQRSIMTLLKEPELINQGQLTKQRWVEILRESGMNDQTCRIGTSALSRWSQWGISSFYSH